jgi:uncharacterized peroxidase-related enzyme
MANILKQGQKQNLTKLNLEYNGKKDGEDQVENYLNIVNEKIGFIPNVLAAFAKFPKQFEGFTKLYNSLMLGESGLTKLEREMIAVTVSSENHCFYCLVAHGSAVRELSNDPQLGERIAANFRSAELPEKQLELLNFTKKLTRDPSEISESDRTKLREVGYTDRDIWDISAIIGLFNMTNRLASATEMERDGT